MDPVTLVAGAVIALVGFGLGHLTGRRRSARLGPPPAVCEGCRHALSFHDEHGGCHATTKARNKYVGGFTAPCACRQYVGEIPAERVLASFPLPPRS
ncbi:hypothetical protein [Saccharothrix obliqua]|uniref:hypothetical protein n=1 Tax=Saccharothrix obliqua TaxID=2861747 RepID=UPI001C5E18DF|nr:hypothetical protein [Saccharothrix obliqua]MBW4719877.1 hypothetical protein [Saccharothrix obliqua]